MDAQLGDDQACGICWDTLVESDEDVICCEVCTVSCHLDCLQRALQAEFASGRLNGSWPCCGVTLSQEQLEHILTEEMMRRLCYYRNRRQYVHRKDVMFCCNDQCWAPIFTEKDDRTAACKQCHCEICTICGLESHGDELCRTHKEPMSEAFAARLRLMTTKSCPQCKVRIEKMHGCNHIFCTHCGIDFCWLCRGVLYRERDDLRRCLCFEARMSLNLVAIGAASIVAMPIAIAAACVVAPPYYLVSYIRKKKANQEEPPLTETRRRHRKMQSRLPAKKSSQNHHRNWETV
mmetsp:Transcript_12091/g.36866  ORF Transcript_12091/g.36866 Transcript_12091/m.36866 type:complete len:291 (+) Transcript_12091:60-932(+)